MRADGQLSVEVQEAIDHVRCIPDGTYEIPPVLPPPLERRQADGTSWLIGGISMVVYLLIVAFISLHVWNREKFTLLYAEDDTFIDAVKPAMDNSYATRGTMREYEPADLLYAADALRNGKVDEAKIIYKRITDRNPSQGDAMHGLAIAYALSGEVAYASACAQRSCSIATTPQRQIALGNVLYQEGKLSKASTVYALAIRRDPVSAVGHFNIANAHFHLGDYVNARLGYLSALDREPSYFKCMFNLSLVTEALGSVAEAKEWMKRAVDTRPTDIPAQYALGLFYIKLGQWAKAETQFKFVLKLNGKHTESQVKLGNLEFRKGRHRRASALYLIALETDPRNVEALTNLAMLDWCKGASTACNEQLRLALTIKPDYYPALYNLAITRLSQGRVEDCVRYYRRARECSSDSPLVKTQMFNLGMALAELDELAENEVPAEYTLDNADHQLVKTAMEKIQADDGTNFESAKQGTPGQTEMTMRTAAGDVSAAIPARRDKVALRSNTQRVYSSLVFISDAMKFSSRLEDCALEDTLVIMYEHDANSVILCKKLIDKATEELTGVAGLQEVDRIGIICPTVAGGVCLSPSIEINHATTTRPGDVADFLKGLNKLLGRAQWRGKRLDFLTLDYTLETNVELLREIKHRHGFECEISCSDKMESREIYELTPEQLKSTKGADGDPRACAAYFDMTELKAWSKLPQTAPRHKVVQTISEGLVAIEDQEAQNKVSWRTIGQTALAIMPKKNLGVADMRIALPPPTLAPQEEVRVARRRAKARAKASGKPTNIVNIDILTDMPAIKFKQHATQEFFCKEIAAELGIDSRRVRVHAVDDVVNCVTIRLMAKHNGNDGGPTLEALVKHLQEGAEQEYLLIDERFGRITIAGVFWPEHQRDSEDDSEDDGSSTDDTKVSRNENATPASMVISTIDEFEAFDETPATPRVGPLSVVSQKPLEPTAVQQIALVEPTNAQNVLDIEYTDGSERSARTPQWDLDANVRNLRKYEQTGIWDTTRM